MYNRHIRCLMGICVINPWIFKGTLFLDQFVHVFFGLFPMVNPLEIETPKREHVLILLGFLKPSNVAERTFHDAGPRAELGRSGSGYTYSL